MLVELFCGASEFYGLREKNKCAPPSEAQLVLANHIGFLETFIMGYEKGECP